LGGWRDMTVASGKERATKAFDMDLVDGDWCQIEAETMESSRHKDIYGWRRHHGECYAQI